MFYQLWKTFLYQFMELLFGYLAHQFLFLLSKIFNNFKHSFKISTLVV